MDKNKAKNRIARLKKEISRHRYLYHVLDRQEMSDGVLDSLKNELFRLEQKFPSLISIDSPTQRVSGKPLKKFEKIEHSSPMLSLFDAFCQQDMKEWEERISKILLVRQVGKNQKSKIKIDYFCELKLDGLAVNLVYEKGVLKAGATRGDGKVGEDVTNNLKTIESIPLRLQNLGKSYEGLKKKLEKDALEIRGEVVMKKSIFNNLNKKYKNSGKPLLANPRNGAAGSIRQLDSALVAARKLDFYAYEIATDLGFKKHEQKREILSLLGFKALKENKYCQNLSELEKMHSYWEKNKERLDFLVDGMVVKVNNLNLWPVLGVVGKGPRYMMAYKFAAQQATTKVKGIKWQVGRTGVLTPIAILEPVQVGGVTISHATLHNMDEIERLGLKIGDTLIVERAGDVIPKLIKVLTALRSGAEKNIKIPKKCPMCGSGVEKVSGEVALRCLNKNCYAARLRQLIHWASKGAVDVPGLGKKIVEHLMREGLVCDAADFYNLSIEDLKPLERFAEKSAKNLIKSITEKKKISLERFIYGLGIRHVGEETAIFLSKKLKARSKRLSDLIKAFQSVKAEEWEEMEDIGPVVAKSIFQWWRDEKNLELIKKLEKLNIKIKQGIVQASNQRLNGKSFVLTGVLSGLTRQEAKAKIREMGASVSSVVSKKTDFVVAGENPGSKYKNAKKLGIKVLTEEEFEKMTDNSQNTQQS